MFRSSASLMLTTRAFLDSATLSGLDVNESKRFARNGVTVEWKCVASGLRVPSALT